LLKENLKLIRSFLDFSSLSLNSKDKSFIFSLIPSYIPIMSKVFANGNFEEYKKAIENKKAVLIIC
jgi:hypothetical protein